MANRLVGAMRIRQVKPAFWSDDKLAGLSEATRLFYIGLWMIADDAGWFRWNPVETAGDLYRYETRTRRERRVCDMFERLSDAGRVVLHPCGHAFIPTMTNHQRLSGVAKQVQTSWKEHQACVIPQVPADPRDSPQEPADPRHGTGRNGIGTEREQGTERNGKGTGKGSARPLAPEGAVALTDEEDVPPHLRVVVLS